MRQGVVLLVTLLLLLNLGRLIRLCVWTLLAALVVLPLLVHAGCAAPRKAEHDKAWYANHSSERRALLRLCESDASYDRSPDCWNARGGEYLARARKLAPATDMPFVTDPAVLAKSPIMQAMQNRFCATEQAKGRCASPGAAR